MIELTKQLKNGANLELDVVPLYGDSSQVAILINGKPVQVINIKNNRKNRQFIATSDFKVQQTVDYSTDTPSLDDVAENESDEVLEDPEHEDPIVKDDVAY